MSDFNPYQSPYFGGAGFTDFRLARPLASPLARLGAKLLDGLICLIVIIPALVLVNLYEDSPDAKAGGVVIVLLGGLILGIIQLVLLTTQGQTIGKRIVSVRIVCNDTGENPGFLKAVLLRAIVNGLIAAIPGVGAFYSLVDILFIFGNERRCIHDMIAGTRVVEA